MVTRNTRWLPDTHPGVEVILQWDDATPEAQRVHTPVAVYEVIDGQKIARMNPRAEYEALLADHRRIVAARAE